MAITEMKGLDGIEKAENYGSKNYLEPARLKVAATATTPEVPGIPGVFALELNKIWYDERRSDNAPYVVAEFVVLESNHPGHPLGSITTRYFDLRPERPSLGELRFLIATFYEAPIEKVGKEETKIALSESQPLAGKKIRVTASEGKSKKGNIVTNCEWAPYEKKAA